MIMDINAKAGTKVVFAHPNDGYPADGKFALEAGLVVGETYTVEQTIVRSWATTVVLQEKPTQHFNSVLFDEVTK